MTLEIQGVAASRGLADGEAYILQRRRANLNDNKVAKSNVKTEIERLNLAFSQAHLQVIHFRDDLQERGQSEIASFFEAQLLMLEDDGLIEPIRELIRAELFNAAWAIHTHRQHLIDLFESMDDDYLKARQDDVRHVLDRVIDQLQDKGEERSHIDWAGKIVVADDLTPADTVHMQQQGVAGFITELGGPLSHAAILARSLGIPAITGAIGCSQLLSPGEIVLLNGTSGVALSAPDVYSEHDFREKQRNEKQSRRDLAKYQDLPAVTACGTAITLKANIELEEDVKLLRKFKGEGVGLYRTEFLYLYRDTAPDEEEHYRNYIRIIRALKGQPLTIRTLDLGADKEFAAERQHAMNPALGLRGIRRSLANQSMFMTQLRAILRAAAKGPVHIMFPMITSLAEVEQTLELLTQARGDLRRGGYKVGEDVKVGVMVEVPAAAIRAESFAKHLDFLSIGTNDLIQYTLAIDRDDEAVSNLYDPSHPAVLTLIRDTIAAGQKNGAAVSVCGEMAGDPDYVRVLLGLGLREFSVPINAMLEVKSILASTTIADAKKLTDRMLREDRKDKQSLLLGQLNQREIKP
ncbi:MAG: phosphoenolpyruvate--protein phosphotransferase [Gammaproteobacteria bacterium]|nr:phosphoenolpyruvate--protein phosphotransferase [Gammaproteobacteria bacterium]